VYRLEFGTLDDADDEPELEVMDGVDTTEVDLALEQPGEEDLEIQDTDEPAQEAGPPRRPGQPEPDRPDPRFEELTRRVRVIAVAWRKAEENPGPFQDELARLRAAITKRLLGKDLQAASALLDRVEQILATLRGAVAGKPQDVAAKKRQQKQQRRHDRLKSSLDAVKKESLPAGTAEGFADEKLDPGKEFKAFLVRLRAFEKERSPQNHEALVAAARAYLDLCRQRWGDAEPSTPEGKRKKEICTTTLKQLRLWRLADELDALGPPPWSALGEARAAELYSKLLFEESSRPATVNGKGGASGAWWIEALDADNQTGAEPVKKKFLFKPIKAEADVPGYPKGGSACREVLGKALSDEIEALTGLTLRTPETHLVAIAGDKLPDSNEHLGDVPAAEYLGSMQHFTKSAGELKGKVHGDPSYLSKILAEECQKSALLDLIGLNTDRHSGNFLVVEEDDGDGGKIPRLVPIDHGLVLPSREGLNARRGNLGFPHSILTRMPGADQPFTREMVARIERLDEDAIVNAIKDAVGTLGRAHPEALKAAELRGDNLALVRRSIQFLKEAARQGLTVAEIYDAYVQDLEQVFDSPESEKAAAFDQAIKAARARRQDRKEFEALYRDRKTWDGVHQELRNLGWCGDSWSLPLFDGWACRNMSLVLSIHRDKRENPALRRELDRMVKELGGWNQLPSELATLPLGPAHTRVKRMYSVLEKAQVEARARAMGASGPLDAAIRQRLESLTPYVNLVKSQDGDGTRLPWLMKDVTAALEQGKPMAANDHLARLTAALDQALEAYRDSHKDAKMELPEFSSVRDELSEEAAREIHAYEALGGDRLWQQLGKDPRRMTYEQKLQALRKHTIHRWAADGNLQKFRRDFPDEQLGSTSEQVVKFQMWKEYEDLGGTAAFSRLGGDGQVASLSRRLLFLRTATQYTAASQEQPANEEKRVA
jgi:hypothetical protein